MADEELRLRFGDYPPVGAPSVTTTLHAPAAADAAEVEPRLAALGAEPVRAGDGSDPRPVAWLIPAPADGRATWVDLVTAFPTSGLWPLIVDGLEGDAGGAWHTGKFTGPDDRIGEPREILERTRLAFGVPDDEDVEEVEEFDADGRMKPSPYYDRIVDVMEELVRFTVLLRPHRDTLTDRYSERKVAGQLIDQSSDLSSIAIDKQS